MAEWVSAYLMCPEPWTGLLRGSVAPFVEDARAAALCDRFFFIRYWEGGPHIRLRMRPAKAVHRDALRVLLDETFGRAMSVVHSAYEPELERYGGSDRIDIAERQFEASSRAVLAALEDDSYDRVLGTAIAMHTAFAAAAGWSREEASAFFDRAITGLAHWLIGPQPTAHAVRELLDAFETRHAPQADGLRQYVDAIWEAEHDVPWLTQWTAAMRALLTELRGTYGGRLGPALPILVSYLHMTNNRLGVANRDEAYLAYLIARSLT